MRTAVQELKTMFTHFFSTDVELRSIGGDVTEVWGVGSQEEEAQPIKLGLIYGDVRITKVEWLDPETGESGTLLTKRISTRLLFLIEHLEKHLSYQTGVQVDVAAQPNVVVNDIYADLSFDEATEPTVARFIAEQNGQVWAARD